LLLGFLACFFGEDEVHLVNGGTKKVSELRSGMKVYSMNGQNKLTNDEVILILHREPNGTGKQLSLVFDYK
jgi:hypothetical protein